MIRRLFIAQARHAQEWSDVDGPGTWILYDPEKKVARTLPDKIQFNVIARRRTALRTIPYSRDPAITVSHDPFSTNFQTIQAAVNGGFRSRGSKYAHSAGLELLIFIHGYGPATYFSGCDSAKAALKAITLNPKMVYEGRISSTYNGIFHSTWFNPVFKVTDFEWDRRQRFNQELTEFQQARGSSGKIAVSSKIEQTSFVQITTDLPPMSDADLGKFLRQQIERERDRTRATGKAKRPIRSSLDDLVTRSMDYAQGLDDRPTDKDYRSAR